MRRVIRPMTRRSTLAISLVLALALLLTGAMAAITHYSAPAQQAAPQDNLTAGRTLLPFEGCTNIMVGKNASDSGATIGTYSCDGPPGANASIHVEPAQSFKLGSRLDITYRHWQPYTWEEYLASLEDKPVVLGSIPQVRHNYRYVSLMAWYDDLRFGGINEYGLTVGETTIGGRDELYVPRNPLTESKAFFVYAGNTKENGLMTLALARAKTAREAVKIIGELVEVYGFVEAGEHITLSDGEEIWAMEIFGVGPGWVPGSGTPGAVWCAQRIPDGHVGVSANRSRIGEVDLADTDHFMASPNIFSLAQEHGWWDPSSGAPFNWHEAYAPRTKPNLREWQVLNAVAPSLGLDPNAVNLPFTVKPDHPVSVEDIMAIHRDHYVGTEYDVTENPAFYVDGVKSPMACPWGPAELFKLLGVTPKRSVGTPTSVFTYISEVKSWLPDPIKGCMWFGFGLADTTCYVPVYSGVTSLPESWDRPDMTRLNRSQAYWAFALADTLSRIRYQEAIDDVRGVRDPAESVFLQEQGDIEVTVQDLYAQKNQTAARNDAEKLITRYVNECMTAVAAGYWQLSDYLLFKYYYSSDPDTMDDRPAIVVSPRL